MTARSLALPALALVAGCAADRDRDRNRDHGRTHPGEARAGSDDPVVARVDGVPIQASEVARQARLAHTSARAALEELVRMELLAAEARRLGHGEDADVRKEAKRASVRRFLLATFETDFTAKDVPESELHAWYEKNRHLYVHPELRKVAHALLAVSDKATPEQRRGAAERALAVRSAVTAARDAAEFRRIAEGLSNADLKVRVEEFITPRRGYTVEEFARAAFALGGPGSISGVVQSSFGYHVIYLVSVDPPVNRSFAEARSQVLEQAWPELSAQAFRRFVDDLSRRHRIVVNDAPLRGPTGG